MIVVWKPLPWLPLKRKVARPGPIRATQTASGSGCWELLDSQLRPVTERVCSPGAGMVPILRQDGEWEWKSPIRWRRSCGIFLNEAISAAKVLPSDGFRRFEFDDDDMWVLRDRSGRALTEPEHPTWPGMYPVRAPGIAWIWFGKRRSE